MSKRLNAKCRIELADFLRKDASNGIATAKDIDLVADFNETHGYGIGVASVSYYRNALSIAPYQRVQAGGEGNDQAVVILKSILRVLSGLRRDNAKFFKQYTKKGQ